MKKYYVEYMVSSIYGITLKSKLVSATDAEQAKKAIEQMPKNWKIDKRIITSIHELHEQ